jgi:hypothetical protein
MRLDILDHGHTFGTRMIFAMIRVVSRHPVPGVVKTLKYRGDFFGDHMGPVFQLAMRGPSEWSVGERELMASFVSKTNECEF